MDYLHTDILRLILRLLDRKTAALCRFVCLKWRKTIKPMTLVNCEDYVDNLKLLKWARSVKCPWGYRLYMYAVDNNNLDTVMWITENNYRAQPKDDLLITAIEHGNLEMVKYLIKLNCKCDIKCYFAAYYGQLHILQYLRSENYPWNVYVILAAQELGHSHIVTWAIENGCPQPTE